MDAIQKGWFSEAVKSQAFSLEVEEILHHEKSKFQDILVFKSKTYGRVLALDGVIQCTDRDEFAYQEVITHIPLFSHPNPKQVLVVGGGDGGVLREVGKHPMVEEMHICEIDERVIEVCKQYFPDMAVGFANPKVQLHIQDGAEFMKQNLERFDVIITDSSDSIGLAECLFQSPYFEAMRNALKPGGIICAQAECLWSELEIVMELTTMCKALFPVVRYALTSIPSMPSGQTGFLLASKKQGTVLEEPLRKISESEVEEMGLQYYNSDVHRAAFVLPQFAKKALKFEKSQSDSRTPQSCT